MRDTSATEVITINAQTAVAKISAATGGAVWGLSSLPLNEIVAILTGILVLAQLGLLIPKYAQLVRAWRSGTKIEVDVK